MKLGILTHPIAGNYGGMLQAYAMVTILTECGHDAKLLDYLPLNYKKRFTKLSKRFDDAVKSFLFKRQWVSGKAKTPFPIAFDLGQKFKEKHIPYASLSISADGVQCDEPVDAVVVGSDQVWRGAYARPMYSLPMFFLDFVKDDVRKKSIAYAASFGTDDWEGDAADTETCGKLLREFRAVGVREHSGCTICREQFATEAQQVPDPTMLLSPEHYAKLIDSDKTWIPENDFLSAYVLDNSGNRESTVRQVAEMCGLDFMRLNARTRAIRDHVDYPLNTAQWLRFVRDSKYLITDSFHGCVFAIIFNKPFVCFGNKKRGTARFDALLSTFGLKDRLVFDASPEEVKRTLCTPIDWERVNAVRAAERARGIAFIQEHLPATQNENRHIVAPVDCTGCALCANVCSTDAITMTWNKDGFLRPQVDLAKCINCGLCSKKCPALQTEKVTPDTPDTEVKSYAAWNNNRQILKESSSGGLFSALAEQTIAEGGIVYGVVWQDKYTATFSGAETVEQLALMRGSKYVAAIPGYIYREVKEQLKNNRKVFFTATTCQVYALKKFLGKEYENLLTMDVLCHGVPSHILHEKYVQENEAATGKTISHVSFRDKIQGWHNYHVKRCYTDGSTEVCSRRKDHYMRIFLGDKVLNYACYNCKFRTIPRASDITSSDYWEIQKKHPEWPADNGISAIIAHSPKGREAIHSIREKVTLQEQTFEEVYNSQPAVYKLKCKEVPAERAYFLDILKRKPLKYVFSKLRYAVDWGFLRISYSSAIYKFFRKIFPSR